MTGRAVDFKICTDKWHKVISDRRKGAFGEIFVTGWFIAKIGDLTSVDFTRASLVECSFTESVLNGTDFSYSTVDYGNFADSDFCGIVFHDDLSYRAV